MRRLISLLLTIGLDNIPLLKLVESFDSYPTLKAGIYHFYIILESFEAGDGSLVHYLLSTNNSYLGISTYLTVANIDPGYLPMLARGENGSHLSMSLYNLDILGLLHTLNCSLFILYQIIDYLIAA